MIIWIILAGVVAILCGVLVVCVVMVNAIDRNAGVKTIRTYPLKGGDHHGEHW